MAIVEARNTNHPKPIGTLVPLRVSDIVVKVEVSSAKN
jgi:hypothetical protein